MASSLAERKPGGKNSRLEEGETRRVETEIARKSRRIVEEAVNERGSVRREAARISAAQTCFPTRSRRERFASQNGIGKLSELTKGIHRKNGRRAVWPRGETGAVPREKGGLGCSCFGLGVDAK